MCTKPFMWSKSNKPAVSGAASLDLNFLPSVMSGNQLVRVHQMFRGREKKGVIPVYRNDKTEESAANLRPRANLAKFVNRQFFKPSIEPRFFAFLVVSWLLLVHFNERIYPYYKISQCDWRKWETWKQGEPHRVLLVADPQIVDDYSYPNRPAVVNFIVRQMSDNYHHRNYKLLQYYLDPDTTFFLGDLFDGGREWNYKAWFKEYQRFASIFFRKPNRRTIMSIPGNHDIGFETISIERAKRFACHFGPPNDIIEIGNHTVVLLDVISMSAPDEKISKPAKAFLSQLEGTMNPLFPRVLLQHVPLFRDNTQQVCGPRRESPNPFPVQKGIQYQTVIDPELTRSILTTIKPTIVFDGDDHDYCDIQHEIVGASPAREITVKSCAMTGGISYPAVQLLSLNNPIDPNSRPLLPGPSYETEMCYLPSPYFILTIYIAWAVVTTILAAIYFIHPATRLRLAAIKDTLDEKNILPSFTPHTKTVTIQTDTRGFVCTVAGNFVLAFCIISIYYHYV